MNAIASDTTNIYQYRVKVNTCIVYSVIIQPTIREMTVKGVEDRNGVWIDTDWQYISEMGQTGGGG